MVLLLLWVVPVALGDWNPGGPHKMHFPQMPDPEGWDVCVVCQWIADDFRCSETGPITDIHFWTSWKEDQVGDIDPTQWDISIWSDAPGQPNVRLWAWNGQGNVTTRRYGTGQQGWVCPSPPALIVRPDHNDFYQVNITNIPQGPEPFVQQEGTIYWLVIRANIPALPSVGWKTSLDSPPNALWGNAALWSTDSVNWTPVNTGTVASEVHDMAFVINGGYVEPDLEYGDAPEGRNAVAYPSTGVTGAFPTCRTVGPATWIQHNNFGGWFGPSFDFEPDGNGGWCPTCFPPYDQDECFQDGDAGLMFPEPYTIDAALNVVPCPTCNGTALGSVCQTAVWGQHIDIHVHNFMPNHPPYVPAYVNVLADWDQNGSWGGSSPCPSGPAREHVLVNFQIPPQYSGPLSALMPAGSGFLIGPNPGYVWTRFTITEVPVTLPWDGSGSFEDGETEDYLLRVNLPAKPLIKHSKWSQPPVEIDPTSEIPTYSGWDEPSWFRPEDMFVLCPNEVADDFRCLSDMPVTSIHWWGSYLYWMEPGIMPPVLPTRWRIRFWSNVPVNPAGDPNYSHPGQLLWEFYLPANRVEVEEVGRDFYHGYYPEDICYQYHVDLEPNEWFWQGDFEPNTTDNVYWLSIQAVYPGLTQVPYPWGWKTRPWSWMDDAVRREMRITEPGVMGCVWVPIKDPLYHESFDVAFELDTDPNWIKWEQHYTGIRHWKHYEDEKSMAIAPPAEPFIKWTQPPDLSRTGVDVDATVIDPCQLLADDFNCVTTGAITNITIWGSWLDDKLPGLPPGDPTQVLFTLSIHTDIPASQSPTGYSMPGGLKWKRQFQPAQSDVQMFMNGVEGYYSPCEGHYDPCNHYIICRYSFDIDRRDAFVQQGDPCNPVVYWLDVEAQPLGIIPGDEIPRFGWKTSKKHWNDDAVWRTQYMPISRPWEELRYPERHPYHPNSIDLAFEITTELEQEPEIIRAVADDWRCDSKRPVTAAVWWGSYLGYRFKPCHGPFMELPKPPDYFLLSVLTDVPAGADPAVPYSHPNDIIWQYKAYDYDEVLVGYDKHPHGGGGIDVAICGAPMDPNWSMDVQAKLLSTGQFNTVDIIDVSATRGSTPTLAQLLAYDAALVYSDNPMYADSNALGNVMADYVDAGGGVVCMMFEVGYGATGYPGAQMQGRWNRQGYYAVPRTGQKNTPQATLGTVYDPTHPIMQGVSTFDGGFDGSYGSHRPNTTAISPGSTLVADWNDTIPLVVTKNIGGTRRADLAFYPPSSDVRADFWDSSTDGALLMANALTWVAGGAGTQPTPREPVFRYSVRLPEEDWFYQKEPNDIYWFSVVAVYDRTMPNYDWGWTNHKHVFNDDAVARETIAGVDTDWYELFDQTGESEDMSFMLFTRECLKHTAPEYADWVAWNKPKCWCYRHQCQGDCDGLIQFGMFWVFTNDLNIFKANFGKTPPQMTPNGICADIDHLIQFGMFRVFTNDLNIFKVNFGKTEPNMTPPGVCPMTNFNFWTSP